MVVWHATMSLDGYIAAPGDAMEWVFEYHEGPNELADAAVRTTGAVLAGRRSYDVGRRDVGKASGEVFGGGWSGPQFVLTHAPPDDEADPTVTFLSGDVRDAVATAVAAAEGGNVLVIGADVARQCVEHGLVDEIIIHLAPVLLGGGVRLYEAAHRVELEQVSAGRSPRVTDLRYRVVEAR